MLPQKLMSLLCCAVPVSVLPLRELRPGTGKAAE